MGLNLDLFMDYKIIKKRSLMYKNMKLDVLVFYNIQFYNHCTFIQCISYYDRLEDVVISDTMDNI